MVLEQFFLKIRRKEGPFYSNLYRIAHGIQRINIPDFLLPFYSVVYSLRKLVLNCWNRVITVLFLSPMFRSRCRKVGKHFNYIKLQQSFPYISGAIQIYFGERVTFHSRSSLAATKVFEDPVFRVGDGTYLGGGFSIGVARGISIGSNCLIASNVTIMDNNGHPFDPFERARNEPVKPEDVAPVTIGDYVWIGDGAIILKGVTIGDCAIVAARSVVARDVEPYTIVGGNPSRVLKTMPALKR
jgi:acetyltransferase-like isoleucine patch superfamily enzyme